MHCGVVSTGGVLGGVDVRDGVGDLLSLVPLETLLETVDVDFGFLGDLFRACGIGTPNESPALSSMQSMF